MNLSLSSNYRPLGIAVSKEVIGSTVLVTGASGFVGSRLVEVLVKEYNCTVYALVRNFSRAIKLSHLPINYVHGDLKNAQWTSQLPPTVNFVFHCAYGNKGNVKERGEIDIVGTRNLMSAIDGRKVEKVIFLSTISIYRPKPAGLIREDSEIKPTDRYGENKLMAERVLIQECEKKKLAYTILRPSAIIGPAAPSYVTRIFKEIQTTEVGFLDRGEGLLNWIFLDDVVAVMINSLSNRNSDGKAYIISNPQAVTYFQYYQSLAAVAREKLNYRFLSRGENEALQKKPRKSIFSILLSAIDKKQLLPLLDYSWIRKFYDIIMPIRKSLLSNRHHEQKQPLVQKKKLTSTVGLQYVDFVCSKVVFGSHELERSKLIESFTDLKKVLLVLEDYIIWERSWQD